MQPFDSTDVPTGVSRVVRDNRVVASSSHPHSVARDCLGFVALTAGQRPDLARATVRWFASHQGTEVNELWGERPGRTPHETIKSWKGGGYLGIPVDEGTPVISYFSADATAEWLIAVAIAAAGEPELAAELESNIHAAGRHILFELDRGGGFVRWSRPAHLVGTGLEAQGWRDARTLRGALCDGALCPLHSDGRPPKMPFADWETQASVLVALRALYKLTGNKRYHRAARRLQELLRSAYYPDSQGLDGDDQHVWGQGSEPGMMLWAGALTSEMATVAADALCRDHIASRWGPRTLSKAHRLYDPVETRRGRVYAHNGYRVACGLHRIGRVTEAEQMVEGIAAAIDAIGDYPIAWAVIGDDQLRAVAEGNSAWTIAVRAAIDSGTWDTADGLCEPV